MELRSRTVALYGRFSPGVRAHLAGEISKRSGRVVRDLTRRADILVIGAGADNRIASGALAARLAEASNGGKVILGEAAFRDALDGAAADAPTLPLDTALAQSGATKDEARLLAAFDLVRVAGDFCRFGDVAVLKSAAALRDQGCSDLQLVNGLRDARRAPTGRRKVIMAGGAPALLWDDGVTTLSGQRLLPLDLAETSVDDLFEEAVEAEADGREADAARLFDMCARTDKSDAIAIYNLGNIHLRQEAWADAAMAYRRALARDADFVEARYNLAQALEHLGQLQAAEHELRAVLRMDRRNSDAIYNLGALRMKQEWYADAMRLFEQYLSTNPPADWSARARRAIAVCSRCLQLAS